MTHPITPPPELVHQWADMLASGSGQAVFAMAAQWGADQELEACCEWFADDVVSEVVSVVAELRAARRPNSPSLKEQALAELEILSDFASGLGCDGSAIRRALEALDD
jgi:hypothetical protein